MKVSNSFLFSILILPMLLAAISGSPQEGGVAAPQQEFRDRFLSDDFQPADILALADHPELVGDRAVQIKLYRTFRHEDAAFSSAVLSLCLQVEEMESAAPMVQRRCNSSFIGRNTGPQEALLQLVLQDPETLQDLRVIGLISLALHSQHPPLLSLGQQVLASYPQLAEIPAVAEAVPESERELPDYEEFVARINPILTAPGSDGRACVDCHSSRPVLFLPSPRGEATEEDLLPQRYRSTLRAIDLSDPEASLILNKPRNPAPETPRSPSGPELHTGGVRFEEGSASYRTLLEWIRSGTSPSH